MEQSRPPNLTGAIIRKLRIGLDLTQEALVAKCDVIVWGVISRSALSKIEACIRSVNDIELLVLARALKVEVTQLYPSDAIAKLKHLSKDEDS